MLQVRCSSLPLLARCSAAAMVPGQIRVLNDSEAAELGTACHWVLSRRILGERCEVQDAADRYEVDAAELGPLVAWGWRAWQQIAGHFPSPRTEVELVAPIREDDTVALSGHADVLSVLDDEVRVADFKTGRLDSDYDDQLRGYAYLACRAYRKPRAYAAILNVRGQWVDGRYYELADLERWFQRLHNHLSQDEVYNPGRHCGHCPRGFDCTAKTGLLKQAVQAFCPDGPNDFVDPATLYDRLRIVESLAEKTRDLIRAHVQLQGGTLPLGDGRDLVIVQQEQRQIVPSAAWPVLLEQLGMEKLLACASISKTKVETEVKSQAGRGQKGAAVADLMGRLDSSGALSTKTVERLESRKHVGNSDSGTHATAGR